MKTVFICCLVLLLPGIWAFAQETEITGKVTDARDVPLPGANIIVKGTVTGTIAGADGTFRLTTATPLPLVLEISMIGFETLTQTVSESGYLEIQLSEVSQITDEIVFSASRLDERLMESPVTVEKMGLLDIRETPSMSFYEGLQNLKGVEMVTSGMTFRQINTRGFNDTGNSRFLQLVDGVDNQTPGLGFAVGNLFGSSDLDMESAELIPGAASALYGPVAFNGVLMMRTKDPFQYQGLTAQVKVGANHFNEEYADPHALSEFAFRYAKAFNNKFAFKINASYFSGLDFYATNYEDVDPGTPEDERGDDNPARNALNIYGDDAARALPGIGRVSRTGYEERHLTDYDVYSLKLNGAVHYRISENAELSYQYNYGQGTANYTGSNRFSINDFILQQHTLELTGSNYFIRAYSTAEDSQDSYNAKGLGQLINLRWVRDFNGNIVSPDQADDMWYQRYEEAFNGNITGVTPADHQSARNFADEGRFLPGSEEFDLAKNELIKTQGLSGAGIYSKSTLYHVEGQYDFSKHVEVLDILVGGNFRMYDMFTNGTLFDDADGSIPIREGGAFVQVSKRLLGERLKLTGSARYDKNQNFDGRITPRFSAMYSAAKNHNIRTSYQTGFRNPTPGDQYIRLNAGPITILGGVPDNSDDLTVYDNSFTTSSLGPFYGAFGQAMEQGATPQEAIMMAKDLLVKSDVDYIKPERVQVFEVGYKGKFSENVLVDINYYFSSYEDFILNQVVIEPESNVLAPDGTVNPQAAADIVEGNSHLYQLYTNASDRVTAQGAGAGLTYAFSRNYTLGANVTYASFNLRDANPDDIPAFNTPEFRTAVTFGNRKLTDRVGFLVAWRWQDAYDWVGTFNQLRPGRIEAFSVVDAQVSYKLPALKTVVKLGGNNILNNQVYQAYGSPSIGAVYYVSFTFDQFMR